MSAKKEINILILGETGVGKSSWINSFKYYLFFKDLKAAMKSKTFEVSIPSSFTFTDDDGREIQINVGENDANEETQVGKSATKAPRSYVFDIDETKIRLIDTPGIGGSDDVEQDRKNFDKTLSYLSKFDEIDAVCIFLKPNNARLTAMFRFCIQEILAQLHSSAKTNIVFCFTNARGTMYRPGDTLPALNEMLKAKNVGILATKDNYFCFDNESFRFLACVKNGIVFEDEDIKSYAQSWKKSVDQTNRLLNYINKLPPHKVRDTLSVNEARRIIVGMGKLLAQVAETIEHNLKSAAAAKKQIDEQMSTIAHMEKNLKVTGCELERLNYPRTACAHRDCVKYVNVGEGRVQNTVYKTCHGHCACDLGGIPTQTTNDPRIRDCWCISGDTCRQCYHHYTMHMKLTYDTKLIRTEFLSKQVQEEIKKMTDSKERKERFKREVDTMVLELKEEEAKIVATSATYGAHLKAIAIMPYNDAVGDYLDMCIKLEEQKEVIVRDEAYLDSMKRMKAENRRQKDILDAAIQTGSGENIRSPELKKVQQELLQLKHFGNTIEGIFNSVSITQPEEGNRYEEMGVGS